MMRVVDEPFDQVVRYSPDAPLLIVTGPVGSRKSDALARRYVELIAATGARPEHTLVASTSTGGARDLVERITRSIDPSLRAALSQAPFVGITLDVLAFAIVADGALAAGLAPDLERLEPYEAEEIFERATAALFSADWADYLGAEIDPEISGLRTPDRFAAAVLRLIVKLRDAGIGPDELLQLSLRAATSFYAQPPNFAEPGLLLATKDEYRAALTVSAAELEHQRRREIDLAKIVAKLYHSYLDELVRHGCLGAGDALAEAARILDEQPAVAAEYRARLRFAVVDDVHDLRLGELRLLERLFGAKLERVTFAGTADSAVQTFAGARPEGTFKRAATTIALPAVIVPPRLAVVRAADRADEVARLVAAVSERLAAGVSPARLAVVHRSARRLESYEDALLAAEVPLALHGDIDLLARADVADALAVLWSAADPYRHAWLLRALQLPLVGLNDASLALLCGEPASPQAMLFELPAAPSEGERRWDRRRDVRLGTNFLRGERDIDLSPTARERVVAFRARRARWALHARDAGIDAARAIVADAGLLAPRDGETRARREHRVGLLEALFGLLDRYAQRYPGALLEDALAMLERVAASERGPLVLQSGRDGVFVGAIDQIGPRRFEHLFVVDVRAGSFPQYYVPDAFLFSPKFGMIPKDAAGDVTTARTAKFTWYEHHAKLREHYAAEYRRLLDLALARADVSATVSAGGRLTRGIGAPELLNELAARCG